MLSKFDALKLIARGNFRQFNDTDWQAFAGVNSNYPMIAEATLEGETFVIVLDEYKGDGIVQIFADGEEANTFYLTD